MKKILLSILCAFFCLFGMAQTEKIYHDQCTVIPDDEPQEPDDIDVTILDNGNGTINITLLNFVIKTAFGNVDPIDFVFENVPVVAGEDGYDYVNDYKGRFTIPSSKLPGKLALAASSFKNIPYTLNGKRNDKQMFATININISISVFMVLNKDVSVLVDIKPKKVYTEQLVVTVNGNGTEPQHTDISVITNDDETINFELKNFFLNMGGVNAPVGNIVVDSLSVMKGEDGLDYFTFDGNITITSGDQEDYEEEDWLGPMLGEIPSKLVGKMNDEKLYVTIDIDMQDTSLGQVIHVELGTDDFFDTPEPEGKVYTEQLVVTINGNSTEPQMTDVTVYDNGNGTINFELKDFFLNIGGVNAPVGNIRVDNLATTEGEDGLLHFTFDGNIVITPGDAEGYNEEDWLGPMLGEIPSKLVGKMNDEKLYVTIDIDMQNTSLGQVIHVELGTDDFFDTPEPEGKVYTEQLVVTINGNSTEPQMTDVTVYDNGNGTINFELKDFFLNIGGVNAPVGNIRVDNLATTEGEDGLLHFTFDGNIVITPGDAEGYNEEDWLGPMLGEIPSKLVGKMNDEKLYVTIDIDMQNTSLGQVIHVELGTDDFFDTPEPQGKVYNDQYVITFNGETSEPQEASVIVIDNEDNTINFVLNDFNITFGNNVIPVGDVSLDNVIVMEGEDGLRHFYQEGTFDIPADKAGSFAYLADMGNLNNIPYKLDGKMNDEKLFATIDINIELLGQLFVQFGTDFIEEIVGDVNGDGKVDVADAQTVLILVADGIYDKKADVNNDNAVDVADVQTVLIMVADQ